MYPTTNDYGLFTFLFSGIVFSEVFAGERIFWHNLYIYLWATTGYLISYLLNQHEQIKGFYLVIHIQIALSIISKIILSLIIDPKIHNYWRILIIHGIITIILIMIANFILKKIYKL